MESVTVAPLTTRVRGIPSEVLLTGLDGVAETCAANLDNIQTIAEAKLRDFVTRLPGGRMREIRTSVEYALGFDLLDGTN